MRLPAWRELMLLLPDGAEAALAQLRVCQLLSVYCLKSLQKAPDTVSFFHWAGHPQCL